MFNLYENKFEERKKTCLVLQGPPAVVGVFSKYYVKTSHKHLKIPVANQKLPLSLNENNEFFIIL